MIMIIKYCGAVLGAAIRISAVPLSASTSAAAATSASTVFGWCAVLGGLCNPYSLFTLFYPFLLFSIFLFFPPLGGSIFLKKLR
jgi:hypothetical protein